MNRETRTLVFVGVMGFGGVVALMATAQRYTKILAPKVDEATSASRPAPPAPEAPAFPMATGVSDPVAVRRAAETATAAGTGDPRRTSRLMDAFAAVRGEMHDALLEGPREGPSLLVLALKEVRDHALRRSGLARDDYNRLLSGYLDWKQGREARDAQLAVAFDERRETFERLDLGRFEEL